LARQAQGAFLSAALARALALALVEMLIGALAGQHALASVIGIVPPAKRHSFEWSCG